MQTKTVQSEPFNQHSWSDGKKTVSIYTKLDELIATSERERQSLRSGGVLSSESADSTTRRNGSNEGVCWRCRLSLDPTTTSHDDAPHELAL